MLILSKITLQRAFGGLCALLFLGGCTKFEGQHPTEKPETQQVVYKDTVVTGFFRRTAGVVAADGGFSIPLSNGNVIWIFGDSYIDGYDPATGTVPCLFQVRNSVALQPFNNWDWQQAPTFTGDHPGINSYFKHTPDDTFFIWPMDGVELGDMAYVFCSNLQKTGDGPWDWGPGGPDMWAKIETATMEVTGYDPIGEFDGIAFGLGMVKDEAEGYVYVYGARQTFIVADVFVARFPLNDPLDWTFWNGNTWDADLGSIASIGEAATTGMHVAKVNDMHVLVSTEFSMACDMGTEIYVSASDSPVGPFPPREMIYAIEDTFEGHTPFFYTPVIHPEYINEQGEVLLTYAINGYADCVENCVNNRFNPDFYRLQGVRVPLQLIAP